VAVVEEEEEEGLDLLAGGVEGGMKMRSVVDWRIRFAVRWRIGD
jgi:hypothetical protein